jgi:N-acetylmuramic acid 6-phosphate etherase
MAWTLGAGRGFLRAAPPTGLRAAQARPAGRPSGAALRRGSAANAVPGHGGTDALQACGGNPGLDGPGAGSDAPPPTEEPLGRRVDLDLLATPALLETLHAANRAVFPAVRRVLPDLARAVDALVSGWRQGGRLIMVGAGTSGRVAVVQAAECPPTFGTPPERVVAVLAGGSAAMTRAVEGAEDDAAAGRAALEGLRPTPADTVVGISASGGAAFVVAAVGRARERGARTVALTSVPGSPLARAAEMAIVPETGPEALAGSTRMKAATAQKMVLDLLTTAAMVRTGHVHGNRMVDFMPSNAKLRLRAVRTVAEVAGVGREEAEGALGQAGWRVKVAVVCARLGVTPEEAERRLAEAAGNLREVLRSAGGAARPHRRTATGLARSTRRP